MTLTQAERQKLEDELLQLLLAAVHIELSTIPLYLYSSFSVKNNVNDGLTPEQAKAGEHTKSVIGVIVLQEMLHLALAGNLMTAIRQGPPLYDKEFIPKYGEDQTILHSKIPMKLEPCEKSNLECFLMIEAPYQAPPTDVAEKANPPCGAQEALLVPPPPTDQFHSIGEFYTILENKISEAHDIVFKNKEKQYSPAEFFGDKMTQIVDVASARKAITLIMDQGEGGGGIEEGHYQRFLELYSKRTTWLCWPVPYSPHTNDFISDPFIYELVLAANAAYCYLLITIQKTWAVDDPVLRRALVGNTHPIMIDILDAICGFLVRQPFGTHHAAPTFEFYDVGESDVDKAAVKLYEAIKSRLQNAVQNTSNQSSKDKLNAILFSVNRVAWPN